VFCGNRDWLMPKFRAGGGRAIVPLRVFLCVVVEWQNERPDSGSPRKNRPPRPRVARTKQTFTRELCQKLQEPKTYGRFSGTIFFGDKEKMEIAVAQ
jgi:hypothetical protein